MRGLWLVNLRSSTMGLLEICLCFIVGTFLPVQSTLDERLAKISGGFIEPILTPAEVDYYIPYDTIFSSWLTETPNFHMLGELPPGMRVPKVQVYCNRSQLTLLVDKIFNGVLLKEEELQLGDNCYSNGDLENQFVFTYDFVQCGTNHVIQNGLNVFSNLLHFNPRKSMFTWWLTPFAMAISCIPKRSGENPASVPVSVELPRMENSRSFAIKAMNPSWTQTAESNIYRRGQNVHLQVTANPGSDQQPFIQSCFVSASPDPKTRPRGWLIVNKGCTASVGSNHAMTQFVASRREDAVNLILNTSRLISEVYIHCSVHISDKGITPDSKSCNYNNIQSRWEELSGDAEVCSCCGSKCKGSLLKHVDAKAVVSTGPLVIVDKRPQSSVKEQNDPSSSPMVNSMQSDSAGPGVTDYRSSNPESHLGGHSGPKGRIIYGAAFSQSSLESNTIPEAPWPSPPRMAEGMLMMSLRPGATQALWLPGQVQVTDAGLDEIQSSPSQSNAPGELQLRDVLSNKIPALHPRAPDQRIFSPPSTNGIGDKGLNEAESDAPMQGVNVPSMIDWWHLPVLDGWPVPPIPMLDGWPIPPKPEESPRKRWGGRSRMHHTRTTQDRYKALPVDAVLHDLNLHESGIDLKREELAQRQAETVVPKEENDAGSVIRSKLQLYQAMDGSQTLSYEEDLVKPGEGRMKIRRLGVNDIADRRKRETGQRGLLSTFLDLLSRKLDKDE